MWNNITTLWELGALIIFIIMCVTTVKGTSIYLNKRIGDSIILTILFNIIFYGGVVLCIRDIFCK